MGRMMSAALNRFKREKIRRFGASLVCCLRPRGKNVLKHPNPSPLGSASGDSILRSLQCFMAPESPNFGMETTAFKDGNAALWETNSLGN